LFGSVFCRVKSSALFGIERLNSRYAKSFKRRLPPFITPKMIDTRDKCMTVMSAINTSEFFSYHPTDRFSCGFLQIEEEILNFRESFVGNRRTRVAPATEIRLPPLQSWIIRKDP
jgi:hypothetical protein